MVLTHIFHLSDLHIRNGDNMYSRYEEYKEVFKETITSIKNNIESLNLSFNDFIIVITGDIFHNKNVIGNYGLVVYRKLIQALSSIGRTYIISGNHDYDQSDVNKPSLVYSSTFAIPNVFVLNDSTSFVIDDIGISFVSIDKTLDNYRNSGRIQDLPQFPRINEDVRYKLALFHGSFAAAKLYNGKCVEESFNPYPLEWVSDFDYVLLGDIHKRQVFSYKNKTICGYAGSLIQQNFGEDIINHGYLIWDLYNRDIKKINVYNNKGFINIKEDENKDILIRINGIYERTLEDYINRNLGIFPKNLDIKMFSSINIFNLNNILQKHNITYFITEKVDNFNKFITIHDVRDNLENTKSTRNDILDTCDNEVCDDEVNNDALINYFKPLLSQENLSLLNNIIKNKEYLLIDVDNYPEELREECLKINKELSAVINTCAITCDTVINHKSLYKIKYLEWEGLLCYENRNWLNMTELDNKIFMVKGQNGTGKSAIYDILLLAIWGENTKKNSLSSGIVNHNKSKGTTIIDIEVIDVNGVKGTRETYRIVRNYTRKNIGNKLQISNTIIYRYLNDEDMEIMKKDTACNSEIIRLFGNMEDFLETSMITQSVDCDILKMDFKSTLELIDKSFNIEYIYNLYNVFNKTINKYKGLHKYIEGKKDVYEKLLITSKYSENHEEDIEKLKEELVILNNKNSSLIEEYERKNTILNNENININIDYEELINTIDLENIVSREIYDINVKRLAELEFMLKGKDIIKLSESYNVSLMETQEGEDIVIEKPCDISIIENENKYLKEYFDIFDNKCYVHDDEYIDNDAIEKLKEEHDDLDNSIKSLILERPNKIQKIDKPIKAKKECLNNIKNIFEKLECLNKIIEEISNLDNLGNLGNLNDINKLTKAKDSEILSLENYRRTLEDKENLEKTIEDYTIKLQDNDVRINNYFNEQQNLNVSNVLNVPRQYTSMDMDMDINKYGNAEEIMKDMNKIDYNYVLRFLKTNEESVEKYNEINGRLNEMVEGKLKYDEELMLLETNEEYHYNPSCEYCCKRSWVNRIRELRIIIQRYDEDIALIKNEFDENIDYGGLIEKMDRIKNIKDKFEILQEWYKYMKSKEELENINIKINTAIENKKKYNIAIENNKKGLENVREKIAVYYNKAIELRRTLDNIKNYEKFKKWEDNYNEYVSKFEEIKNKIKKSVDAAHYNNNIKPRIITHRALVAQYNKWEKYNINKNIINSREYLDIKDTLDNYRKNEMYKKYKEMKHDIKRVAELKKIIKENDDKIGNYRDNLTEKMAIFNYNKLNIKSLEDLRDILDSINNTLTTLDTIIINFQDFRINLYEKIILKKLLRNTNNMLKNICHSMTKPFELDYIINVSRDIIHINWLIRNVNIDADKSQARQVISINQASGFQQFVISMALRLCLFGNNRAICKQLYIDEGFVSFDKYNLSIVPNFLKSLLAYFDTIIIVSHIDLIQESIEDNECIAEINYNNTTSVSNISYKKSIDNSCKTKKKL